MDLSVRFMGLKLKNPIIVAAGPLTASGEMMRRAAEAGAGAVVTKTIVNEIRPNVRPRLVKQQDGMQNIELYSEFTLEEWEEEIAYAKEYGATVIASILAHTPSEMAYIARRVEKFGADAIELGMSSPNGEGLEVLASDPAKLYELTSSATKRVKIPVMVKLSPNVNNMAKLAKAAEKAGASAISAIDTVRSIIGVDIERGKALLPTYGGYSGSPIRPIGLAAVATVSQAVSIPVCGIGGIGNYHHVIEYIMLGASTVQLCTSIILNGFSLIGKILHDLEEWMTTRGYRDFEQIRGTALSSLKSFGEIKVEPYVLQGSVQCNDSSCNLCIKSCIYGAIQKDEHMINAHTGRCTGCGLCISTCPSRCLKLVWKV